MKSLDDLQTVNELAGFWLQVTKTLSSFKEERLLPIHDAMVCWVEATIGGTFLGGEQQVWFAVLAICCSNMILELEVKFQLKRGGDVRIPNLASTSYSLSLSKPLDSSILFLFDSPTSFVYLTI